MVIEINRDNFEQEVVESEVPVLVDFWGPQCKPCLALTPAVEELEKVYTDKIKVTKLCATENRMLCARLRVLGLPTFLFYKDAVEVNRLTGDDITKNGIREAIDTIVA